MSLCFVHMTLDCAACFRNLNAFHVYASCASLMIMNNKRFKVSQFAFINCFSFINLEVECGWILMDRMILQWMLLVLIQLSYLNLTSACIANLSWPPCFTTDGQNGWR